MSRSGSRRASALPTSAIEADVVAEHLPVGFIEDDVVADHAGDAAANGAGPAGSDEEQEEEYEVQAIVSHKLERGKYKYLVSWKGYGPEHNTWEPQGNVEHAEEVVSAYWSKQPKIGAGVIRKRGRPSTGSNAGDASTSRANKRAAKTVSEEVQSEDDEVDFAQTHIDGLEKYEDVADWEDLVRSVDTVERNSNNELIAYLTMSGGEKIAQNTQVVNRRAPQKLLKFYESHLKWRPL